MKEAKLSQNHRHPHHHHQSHSNNNQPVPLFIDTSGVLINGVQLESGGRVEMRWGWQSKLWAVNWEQNRPSVVSTLLSGRIVMWSSSRALRLFMDQKTEPNWTSPGLLAVPLQNVLRLGFCSDWLIKWMDEWRTSFSSSSSFHCLLILNHWVAQAKSNSSSQSAWRATGLMWISVIGIWNKTHAPFNYSVNISQSNLWIEKHGS